MLARELHANISLYVAIITLLIGVYTLCKVVVGTCLYLVFCFQNELTLSPFKAVYLYTAKEIQKEIQTNHWLVRFLLKIIVGSPEKFAKEIAYGAVYNSDISRLLAGRLVYYVLIVAAYMLGYNVLYEKLINIDFHNFFHPFIWAWVYLTSSVNA